MSNHEPAHESEADLHIDMAPLSTPGPAPEAGAPQPHRRARGWRAALVRAAVLIALAVLVVSLPPVRGAITRLWATPTPTPAALPTATAAALGAVPTSCPPDNNVETFAPQFGPGMSFYNNAAGQLHVWLLGFSGPTDTLPSATLHLAGAGHTVHGWPHQLTLVAASDVTQPITLSGQVVTIGLDPVLFSTDASGQATKTITFDPQSVAALAGGWKAWRLYIYIQAVGCYYLGAHSGATDAASFFAAGR